MLGSGRKKDRGLEEEVEAAPVKRLVDVEMSDRVRSLHEARIRDITDPQGIGSIIDRYIEAGKYAESKGMYTRAAELYESAQNEGRNDAIRVYRGLGNEEKVIELYEARIREITDPLSSGNMFDKNIKAARYAEKAALMLSKAGQLKMLERAAGLYEETGDQSRDDAIRVVEEIEKLQSE